MWSSDRRPSIPRAADQRSDGLAALTREQYSDKDLRYAGRHRWTRRSVRVLQKQSFRSLSPLHRTLSLYLDSINLFMMMLRLIGGRKKVCRGYCARMRQMSRARPLAIRRNRNNPFLYSRSRGTMNAHPRVRLSSGRVYLTSDLPLCL